MRRNNSRKDSYDLLKNFIETTLSPESREPYLKALKELYRPDIERQIINLVDDLYSINEDLRNRLVDFQQHDKTWYAADALGDCVKTIEEYIKYIDNYESNVINAIELGQHIADSDGINW